ncbi:MAG: protein translocase subunit SecD [Hyphomonadaceae bacterium]
MLQFARWRLIFVLTAILFGVLFSLPNLLPANLRSAIPSFLPSKTLNLGLDLRGGSYLLLEVDLTTLKRQRLEAVADQMATALREASPRINYAGRGVVEDAARVRLLDPADAPRAMTALQKIIGQVQSRNMGGGNPDLALTSTADGIIEARITPDAMVALSRDAATRSIEVIRRRVDPTGASEVSIARQGDDRIAVQAPGESDPESLKSRIGQTALLTFHLVDDQADMAAVRAGRIPPGDMIAEPYAEGVQPELVRRRPSLTGSSLQNATARTDQQTGQFVISFQLDGQGARTFCRLSTQYVGHRFAILLDNKVLTAPNIREPICGGSGQIDGNFTAQSSSELALLLRAGALPVPLTVIEQRSVGAELGQDAINSGAMAGIVASAAVVIFMILAYGLFGVFACLALVVNVGMIVAAMSVGQATLSLPGIAGLVLTIGMAVDANVLIYERMREEQAAGRGPAMAVEAGFNRALVTIIDSHLTQIGVALILFQFGHGPVRGFAWTLSIGVVTSVITATIVTQFFIALWFRAARPRKLPI